MVEEYMESKTSLNAYHLNKEFNWLTEVVNARMKAYFEGKNDAPSVFDIPPPDMIEERSLYANFVQHYDMNVPERITFLLALAPHVQPQLLDSFFQPNQALHRGFTEFGGVKGSYHSGFIPTLETLLFVLAGTDLSLRFELEYLFHKEHFFNKHKILFLDSTPFNEPRNASPLVVSSEVIDLITQGEIRKPDFSRDFPAKLLSTPLEWDHLILSPTTAYQLNELQAWIEYKEVLMNDWEMHRKLKPGYRCLFYGPPGTGKTLTATLLGKKFNKEVFRVDLSTVISKYIGETEKNLERIFERTSYSNCILFFDEADALFGKRTNVNEAHDRYANQEVSYLLQRIEDYEGLVILASNFKSNIDEAFLRRFQSVVHFPMPDVNERLRLWKQSFSSKSSFEEAVDLMEIAKKYKIAGGSIVNITRYASLMAIQKQSMMIRLTDIIKGIKRELQKEGKNV